MAEPEHQALEKVSAALLSNATFHLSSLPLQSLIPPFQPIPPFCTCVTLLEHTLSHRSPVTAPSESRERALNTFPYQFTASATAVQVPKRHIWSNMRFTGIALYGYRCECTKDQVFIYAALCPSVKDQTLTLHPSTICFSLTVLQVHTLMSLFFKQTCDVSDSSCSI